MKLFLISQTERNGYDTYDAAVVAAETEGRAKEFVPDLGFGEFENDNWSSWASKPENVSAKYIGEAAHGTKEGLILASFNAG